MTKSNQKKKEKYLRLSTKLNPKMKFSSCLSARYISTLCLFVTGIYGQSAGRPNAIDTGNNVCIGACVTSLHELRCETPTVPLVCEPPFDFYDNFFSVLFFFFYLYILLLLEMVNREHGH